MQELNWPFQGLQMSTGQSDTSPSPPFVVIFIPGVQWDVMGRTSDWDFIDPGQYCYIKIGSSLCQIFLSKQERYTVQPLLLKSVLDHSQQTIKNDASG